MFSFDGMRPEKDKFDMEVLLGMVVDGRGCVNWLARRQLQGQLENEMVNSLSLALSRRYEMLLWNFCFKNVLDLRFKKGCKGVASNKLDSVPCFSPAIPTAEIPSHIVGSLNSLMSRLIYKYNARGERIFNTPYVGMGPSDIEPIKGIRRSDYLYAIQFCLVHIGDVLRHQRFLKEAQSYYEKALSVSTHYGHPYNQLGILETVGDKKLAAAYFYLRALHSTVSFANAGVNLERLYLSIDLNETAYDSFPHNLLQLQAALYLDRQVDIADKNFEKVAHMIVEHVQLCVIKEHELMQIFITSLGCLQRVMTTGETRTIARWQSRRLHILVGFLQVLLVDLLECGLEFLLKHVPNVLYTFCRWAHFDWPKLLHMNDFIREVRFLRPLVKLLKNGQSRLNISVKEYNEWNDLPLPTDRLMEGFQLLSSCHSSLDLSVGQFRGVAENPAHNALLLLRLMQFGAFVSECLCDKNLLDVKVSEKEKLQYEFQSCTMDSMPNDKQVVLDSVEQKSTALPTVKLLKHDAEKNHSTQKALFPKKNLFLKEGKAFFSASDMEASLTKSCRLKLALGKKNQLNTEKMQNGGLPVVHPTPPAQPSVEVAELLYLLDIRRKENGAGEASMESSFGNISSLNCSQSSGYAGEVAEFASKEINGEPKWQSLPSSPFDANNVVQKARTSSMHLTNVQEPCFKAGQQPTDSFLNGYSQQYSKTCWSTFHDPVVNWRNGPIREWPNADCAYRRSPIENSTDPFGNSSPLSPLDHRPRAGQLRPIGFERNRRFKSAAP
ncbi:EST1 DNA bind domain containing protein [Trichuris trichiura]|uniref:EST1 DNA bind domain containing protein n=1 Tax=Trichuris trichiura TaxID=36087 RepID=A0A077ZAY7_TRITR|nr:EST1 DNA bind domain containing protein [Trichuris trichiura]